MDGERIQLRDMVKWIRITKFGYFEYKHSFDGDEQWKEACIVKTGAMLPLDQIPDMPVLPISRSVVQRAKVDDIKKQLEFIPSIYQGYYRKIIDDADVNLAEHSSTDGDNAAADDDQEVSIPDPGVSEVSVHIFVIGRSHGNVFHMIVFNGLFCKQSCLPQLFIETAIECYSQQLA